MLIQLDPTSEKLIHSDALVLTAFQKNSVSKDKKETMTFNIDHWKDQGLKEEFKQLKNINIYKANKDEMISFTGTRGETIKVIGIGEKAKYKNEELRRSV